MSGMSYEPICEGYACGTGLCGGAAVTAMFVSPTNSAAVPA